MLPWQPNVPFAPTVAEQSRTARGEVRPVLYFTFTVSPGAKCPPRTPTDVPFGPDDGEMPTTGGCASAGAFNTMGSMLASERPNAAPLAGNTPKNVLPTTRSC